jgi:probable phosphoglycerate mutase
MSATRFCIVRHGETDWNAQRRIQGQIDIPLNAVGRAQAEAAAVSLAGCRFDAVYSSDLARAWHTAAPVAEALGLPLVPAPGLRERHYGRMQGLTGTEAADMQPEVYAAYAARDLDHDLDGGESLGHFAERVRQTLLDLAESHPGDCLLLVAHGGVLDIVYRLVTGRDLAGPRDFPVPNAGLNWLEYADGAWRLVSWGECNHLDAARDEVSA